MKRPRRIQTADWGRPGRIFFEKNRKRVQLVLPMRRTVARPQPVGLGPLVLPGAEPGAAADDWLSALLEIVARMESEVTRRLDRVPEKQQRNFVALGNTISAAISGSSIPSRQNRRVLPVLGETLRDCQHHRRLAGTPHGQISHAENSSRQFPLSENASRVAPGLRARNHGIQT